MPSDNMHVEINNKGSPSSASSVLSVFVTGKPVPSCIGVRKTNSGLYQSFQSVPVLLPDGRTRKRWVSCGLFMDAADAREARDKVALGVLDQPLTNEPPQTYDVQEVEQAVAHLQQVHPQLVTEEMVAGAVLLGANSGVREAIIPTLCSNSEHSPSEMEPPDEDTGLSFALGAMRGDSSCSPRLPGRGIKRNKSPCLLVGGGPSRDQVVVVGSSQDGVVVRKPMGRPIKSLAAGVCRKQSGKCHVGVVLRGNLVHAGVTDSRDKARTLEDLLRIGSLGPAALVQKQLHNPAATYSTLQVQEAMATMATLGHIPASDVDASHALAVETGCQVKPKLGAAKSVSPETSRAIVSQRLTQQAGIPLMNGSGLAMSMERKGLANARQEGFGRSGFPGRDGGELRSGGLERVGQSLRALQGKAGLTDCANTLPGMADCSQMTGLDSAGSGDDPGYLTSGQGAYPLATPPSSQQQSPMKLSGNRLIAADAERGKLHHITPGGAGRWKAQLWRKGTLYFSRCFTTPDGAARAADLLIYRGYSLQKQQASGESPFGVGPAADVGPKTNFPLDPDVEVLVDRMTLEQVARFVQVAEDLGPSHLSAYLKMLSGSTPSGDSEDLQASCSFRPSRAIGGGRLDPATALARGDLHHITPGGVGRWKAQLFRKGKMYFSRFFPCAEVAAHAADLLIYRAQSLHQPGDPKVLEAKTNFPLDAEVKLLLDKMSLEQVGRYTQVSEDFRAESLAAFLSLGPS